MPVNKHLLTQLTIISAFTSVSGQDENPGIVSCTIRLEIQSTKYWYLSLSYLSNNCKGNDEVYFQMFVPHNALHVNNG